MRSPSNLMSCIHRLPEGIFSIEDARAGSTKGERRNDADAAGFRQDRACVAGGRDCEVRYETKKTGRSASAVEKAVKKVGNTQACGEAARSLKGSSPGPVHPSFRAGRSDPACHQRRGRRSRLTRPAAELASGIEGTLASERIGAVLDPAVLAALADGAGLLRAQIAQPRSVRIAGCAPSSSASKPLRSVRIFVGVPGADVCPVQFDSDLAAAQTDWK